MVKTIFANSWAFWFYPCRCGHYQSRHSGTLDSFPKAGYCFDCECQEFEQDEPFDRWSQRIQAMAQGRAVPLIIHRDPINSGVFAIFWLQIEAERVFLFKQQSFHDEWIEEEPEEWEEELEEGDDFL